MLYLILTLRYPDKEQEFYYEKLKAEPPEGFSELSKAKVKKRV